MTAKVGFPTLRLVRFAIGEHTLEGLVPGAWRQIGMPIAGDKTSLPRKTHRP
ncbi:ribosomal large subunit pseudouridine synthase E [mine drainage metagenome]|uniref:Ribosomal large subunit pseudouridine synthase E n=1 Tax=mine drainage metagenome TaxID=410659 RepID=A0A1J5QMZ3_9ZZZZ